MEVKKMICEKIHYLKNRNVFFLNFSCSSRARAGPIWAYISDCWFNFVCFGSKAEFLTKFLNDSAWFCVEKLKNTFLRSKSLKTVNKSPKIFKNTLKCCPPRVPPSFTEHGHSKHEGTHLASFEPSAQ